MIRKDGFSIGFSAALGTVAALVLLYVAAHFGEAALGIATPFVVALAIALMLDPLVTKLQKKSSLRKRFPAVLVVFLLFLLFFGALMTYLFPILIDQTQRLVRWFTPVTYKIRRATQSNGPYRTVVSDITGTTYTIKRLENGTQMYFTVYAQGTQTDANGDAAVELPIGPPVFSIIGRDPDRSPATSTDTPDDARKNTKAAVSANQDTKPSATTPNTTSSAGGTLTTRAGLPSASPGEVKAVSGDGQVTLLWQAPANTESGFDKFRAQVDKWLSGHRKIGPIALPANTAGLTEQYSDQVSDALKMSASNIAGLLLSSASKLIYVILIPIITFYLLLDLDRLRGRAIFLLPDRIREPFRRSASDVGQVFGSYVRGMLTVSLMYGVTAVGVFFLCGLGPYAILLGVAAGILYTIPFVGPLVTSLLAAIVSLATGHDVGHTVWVLVAALVQNQVFDNVIVPRVIGHSVGLHPLVTLTSLFLGGEMFGIWGMLLSVPVAASIQVVLFRLFPKLSAPTPLSTLMSRKDIEDDPPAGSNPDTKNADVASHQPVA